MGLTLGRFAWGVIAYTLLVIVWGAFVRATGSGAGCGANWPTCNGEVVPRSPSAETLIEFTHRATSGLALIAVVALAVWTFRARGPGAPERRFAVWSVLFILLEAAIGAGLVLFELVGDDRSLARGYAMGAHLVNTFFLLAALTLTALYVNGARRPVEPFGALCTLGMIALLATGVTGGIAALGDTLFPASSLAEGFAQDLSPEAHAFVQLRVSHPIVAVLSAALLLYVATTLHRRSRAAPAAQRAALALGILVVVQVLLGLVNLALLAPVALQLAHLLLADAIWIALVILAVEKGGTRLGAAADGPRLAGSGPQGASAASLRMASVMSCSWGTDAISSVSASPMPGTNFPASSRGGA